MRSRRRRRRRARMRYGVRTSSSFDSSKKKTCRKAKRESQKRFMQLETRHRLPKRTCFKTWHRIPKRTFFKTWHRIPKRTFFKKSVRTLGPCHRTIPRGTPPPRSLGDARRTTKTLRASSSPARRRSTSLFLTIGRPVNPHRRSRARKPMRCDAMTRLRETDQTIDDVRAVNLGVTYASFNARRPSSTREPKL